MPQKSSAYHMARFLHENVTKSKIPKGGILTEYLGAALSIYFDWFRPKQNPELALPRKG